MLQDREPAWWAAVQTVPAQQAQQQRPARQKTQQRQRGAQKSVNSSKKSKA
jgi:hypothetical protein